MQFQKQTKISRSGEISGKDQGIVPLRSQLRSGNVQKQREPATQEERSFSKFLHIPVRKMLCGSKSNAQIKPYKR